MSLDANQTFLKWAGGKRRMTNRLLPFAPPDAAERVYHEPFLGAASMFLAIRPKRAYLADLNEDLISTFRFVRDQPALVARYLRHHARNNSEQYYYSVRNQFNSATTYSCMQASRFLYLNRTCYNGVFRVNLEGDFNVPYGRRRTTLFPTRQHLAIVSAAFRYARLEVASYDRSLQRPQPGDFVYLDPPYPPLNGTSFFRHYTPERFSDAQQEDLAEHCLQISRSGCLLMMSNADTPFIRDLYAAFHLHALPVTRWISSKNEKHAVSELVITNY